jgi:LytS/YehU family sensor histidine kinase
MVLNNSEKELIALSSEIEMLNLYLSLESLRFSKSFQYEITIDAMIDPDEIMVPSLITQPYVENAVWHGLRNKQGDKKVSISCMETNGQLIISIDDNGIGRKKAAQIKEQKITGNQYASKGSTLSTNRILLLNHQYKTDIQANYTDKTDKDGVAEGTTVRITLPNNLSALNTQP